MWMKLSSLMLVAVATVALLSNKIKQLPYGPATFAVERPSMGGIVDTTIKTLSTQQNMKIIRENLVGGKHPLLIGPETIVFDDDGTMYALTRQGKVVKVSNFVETSDANHLIADTEQIVDFGGSPLGGKFVPGTKIMYFADDHLGLCRIDVSKQHPKVEIVANRVVLKDGSESKISFADDVDIGPLTGKVYFSDATSVRSDYDAKKESYDSLEASKIDLLRGVKSGRLLEYDPETDEVKVLADGIWFANGVAVDRKERFIVVTETFMLRALKYHLEGPKKGELEVLVDNLIGVPDGADCSKTADVCYSPLPSSITPLFRLLYSKFMPKTLEAILKTMFLLVPKTLSPKPAKYACIVEYTSGADVERGKVLRVFQDPYGEEVNLLTGVTIYGSKLYFSSLHHNFIGVLDI
jgi:sugar lactone lactonase YvrE